MARRRAERGRDEDTAEEIGRIVDVILDRRGPGAVPPLPAGCADVVLAVHSYAGMIGTAIADRMPQRLRHLDQIDGAIVCRATPAHLGRTTVATEETGSVGGSFTGTSTYVAANGDRLYATVSGVSGFLHKRKRSRVNAHALTFAPRMTGVTTSCSTTPAKSPGARAFAYPSDRISQRPPSLECARSSSISAPAAADDASRASDMSFDDTAFVRSVAACRVRCSAGITIWLGGSRPICTRYSGVIESATASPIASWKPSFAPLR